MSKSSIKIEIECLACQGTGLYKGLAEPDDVGIICTGCEGEGNVIFSYTPFTARKKRSDVKWVRRSTTAIFLSGAAPAGEQISYEEFLLGKKPALP